MNPAKDLIFIIGRQRSGTTVLRNLLEAGGALSLDEIMHGEPHAQHERFYEYVAARCAKDPRLVHPQHHRQLFRDFIDKKRAEAGGRPLAIDTKYFGLNMIPGFFEMNTTMPFLVGYMRNHNAHIVHLIRHNKLRILVSEEIARQTGIWSAQNAGNLPKEKQKITVNPTEILMQIQRHITTSDRVRELIHDQPTAHELAYEKMFDPDGSFTQEVATLAATLLGVDAIDRQPAAIRMNPEPLSALIENYDELTKTLSNSPHAWMLDEA